MVAETPRAAPSAVPLDPEAMANVGKMLLAEFEEIARLRRPYEKRWIEDMLQVQGKYSVEVKRRLKNGSKVFIRLTTTKVRAMRARILDTMFPSSGERNWDVLPTPDPTLDSATEEALQRQAAEQGHGKEQVDAARLQLAQDRAKNMARLMEDQLVEAPDRTNMRQVADAVLNSGLVYGTGILKGPLVQLLPKARWKTTGEGWVYDEGQETKRPYFECVSLWNFFPDMTFFRVNECRKTYQHHQMNKADLLALSNRKDFNRTAILAYVKQHPDGTATLMDHQRSVREVGEQEVVSDLKGTYRVLERWGWMSGSDLRNCGVEISDDQVHLDFASQIWLLDDVVIKAVLSPVRGMVFPYYLWYFEKPENSIFGTGVPEAIADPQSAFNSAMRGMLDAAAMSSGPLVGVNKTAFEPTEDDKDGIQLYPKRVFEFSDAEDMTKAIIFYSMPFKVEGYLQAMETLKALIDETTVPAYMGGNMQVQGAAKTMGGLSMLMGALSIVLAYLVKSYDDCITCPFIEALYNWNMQFSDDPSVKGDYNVKALGMSMLLAKEVQSQRLLQLAQLTDSPRWKNQIKDRELLQKIVSQLGCGDELLRSEEEEQAYLRQQATMAAQAQLEAVLEAMEKRGVDPRQALAMMLQQTLAQQGQQGAPMAQAQ